MMCGAEAAALGNTLQRQIAIHHYLSRHCDAQALHVIERRTSRMLRE
jgi:hypothetical protein